jgi:predicted ATPase
MAILKSQLDQLENVQLVRRLPEEELAYLFKHALTQESAYESILLKKRREIHRFVAEAYEQLYAERLDEIAALLTQHFAQAASRNAFRNVQETDRW